MSPVCTSCNKPIDPSSRFVRFECLNCGEVTIWRCNHCRKFAREYRCPRCGFRGP